MDEEMTVRTDIDGALARRLEAYAEARLSPELATSARLRARVMASAHRQATLARADASLSLVPPGADAADPAWTTRRPASGRRARRLAGAAALAAALLVAAVGTTVAARAGGPLYDTRLWVETLTLPSDPSERVLAELSRLTRRLEEAAEAGRAGDDAAAAAALGAYGTIVDEASTQAVITGDVVAGAALEAGVARNIAVLDALTSQVPDGARGAIGRAIERAIARSDDAVRAVGGDHGVGGASNAGSGPVDGANDDGADSGGANGSGADRDGANGAGGAAGPSTDGTPAPGDKSARPARGNGAKPSGTPDGTAAPAATPAAPVATPATPTHGPGGGGSGNGGTGGDQGGSNGGGDQGGN